jgi:L-amino acid N-acyltransferase YncA
MIREAREEDLPAIVAIYNASIPGRASTADTEPVSVDSRREWFRQHGPGRHPLWVAERGQRVAGWLSFGAFYGRPAYAATAEVSVYVAPDLQRQGIGSELLREALLRAPGLRIETLLGMIFAHNQASLALFTRLGFERWALLPRVAELDGVKRDLVIMGRHVSG